MAHIGEKRTVLIQGRKVPGVISSETTESVVEVESRDPARKGQIVRIPVFRADIVTLRETNPANGEVTKFLTITNENLRFAPPRFSYVKGLDIDPETGAMLSLEELIERATDSMAEFQLARLAATMDTEVEADLA